MRLTIPSSQVRKVASHGYVEVCKRALNQNPLYWITFKGTTIHFGKKRHIARKFNYYRGQSGKALEMSAS